MNKHDDDQALGECLEDYHRRKALGERTAPADYSARIGARFEEFLAVIATEETLDRVLEPEPLSKFPHPFGGYTLIRELGRGAVGVVYEAVHRRLGRKVALKVLRTDFDTEEIALERFRREARACAQVRHENIVEIHDAGEADGRLFYSMALVEGRSLASLIGSGELPPPDQVCRGLAGVADALQALHDAGIIHRDVKPANIIVRPDGEMILADFGLARTAKSAKLTTTGHALGTPLYMSPEQILGVAQEIGGQADVYGLGAALYEALTGHPVFDADHQGALLRMILNDMPVQPSEVRPGVPEACERIVMKAVEKRKEDRYATAAEMRADLLAFADGGEVQGRPVSPARRHLRRHGGAWMLAATVAVAAVVGGSLYTNRPGSVTLRTLPVVAQVEINGASHGETELTVSLSPGEHRVVLRAKNDLYEELSFSIDLAAGAELERERVLKLKDPGSIDDVKQFMKSLGVAYVGEAMRAPDPLLVDLISPRQLVAAGDLVEFHIEVSDLLPEGSSLEFLRDGSLLHSVAFEPESRTNFVPFPDELRAQLQPGDTISWGYRPPTGKAIMTSFKVADDAQVQRLQKRLTELEPVLNEQDERVRNFVRWSLLLDQGMAQAAYREAREFERKNPGDPRAVGTMVNALADMGANAPQEVVNKWNALTTEQRAQLGLNGVRGKDGDTEGGR